MPRFHFALRQYMLLLPIVAAFVSSVDASAAELTFDLRIEQGQVPRNMRLVRVKQSDVVKLRWSTDRPLTLHLHGYDIALTVERGVIAEMTFTARATGRFPVHVHDVGGRAGSHSHQEAPLVLVEVYPR